MSEERKLLMYDRSRGCAQGSPEMLGEQLRLIAGVLNVGQCRYCGAVGEIHNTFQVRHEHTDECVLSLNARLQASLQSVLTSHNTEEQG